VVVFGYVRPDGIPEGIEWCNAEEILPRTEFLFAPNGSPALGTDLFRYRLQVHGHGLWLDADILLLKPLEKLTTPVYGWQDELRMNAAVLYLPPDSAVLQDLITYTSTNFPVPPFVPEHVQSQLRIAIRAGTPVHVSQMPWGIWGPFALTHFVKANRMEHFARPPEVFYPIHFSVPHKLVSAGEDVDRDITDATLCVHLWNNNLRKPSRLHPEVPAGKVFVERGSFFERFCREQLDLRVPEIID